MRRVAFAGGLLSLLAAAARAGDEDETARRLRAFEERLERIERDLGESEREAEGGGFPLEELLHRAKKGDDEARERLKRVAAKIGEALREVPRRDGPDDLRRAVAERVRRYEAERAELDPRDHAKRERVEERIFRHHWASSLLDEVDGLRARMTEAEAAGKHGAADAIEREIASALARVQELIDGPHPVQELAVHVHELQREVRARISQCDVALETGKNGAADEIRQVLGILHEADDDARRARASADEAGPALREGDEAAIDRIRGDLETMIREIVWKLVLARETDARRTGRPGLGDDAWKEVKRLESRHAKLDASRVEVQRRILILEDKLAAAKQRGRERDIEEVRTALGRHYEALKLAEDARAVASEQRGGHDLADAGDLRGKLEKLERRITELIGEIR